VFHTPAPLQTLVSIVIEVATIIVVFAALFALTTVFERKGLGRMQNRYGPNRVGPFGVFQPIADAVKSLTKEDVVPRAADHVVHYLAPLVLVGVVFLTYAVLPVGRNMTAVNLDSGRAVLLRSGRSDRAGRSSWRGGRATTNIHCWARCARSRRW
jgi:NADH-quinone oxidoreductase subunit H